MMKPRKMSLGLWDTVPAKKKLKFITRPKNITVVVKQPKINPKPIDVSPQGTITLNTSTFGSPKCFKKSTYQPNTMAPFGTFTGFAMAPLKIQLHRSRHLFTFDGIFSGKRHKNDFKDDF